MWSLLLVACLLRASSAQQLDLHEGDACTGGVCTRPDACHSIESFRTTRPAICSFHGSTVILCCPHREPKPLGQSLAAIMCASYSSELCAGVNRVKRDFQNVVVGGKKAKARKHRHMALIGYGSRDSLEWQCGGSIISQNFILTAAHCSESPNKGAATWVRVGDLDTQSTYDDASPQDVEIWQRFLHPAYNSTLAYHDIALFKLRNNIQFDSWVSPICLTTQPYVPQGEGTIAGWGRTDIAMDLSSHLLEVSVNLREGEFCKEQYGRTRKLPRGIDTNTMICAGEEEGGKDACMGDSGGPLTVEKSLICLGTQIGVISFGRLCGLPNIPGVYTNIFHYLPWIESVAWADSNSPGHSEPRTSPPPAPSPPTTVAPLRTRPTSSIFFA